MVFLFLSHEENATLSLFFSFRSHNY
uniref:Uncharacterized protein n=1 Tax=Arundo donax TaxID=35708 RepID=A0A0A8ZFA8_ARUDO